MTNKKSKNNSSISWSQYMTKNNSKNGFYILSDKKNIYFGPFKNKQTAEFFSYISFQYPTADDGPELAIEAIKNIDFNKFKFQTGLSKEQFLHPKYINYKNCKAQTWWEDTYNIKINEKLALSIAYESGANGYKSFSQWIIGGSKIKGKTIHALIN